jgi:hypothetical protein
MTRALLQQALEALEIYFGDYPCDIDRFDRDGYAAITAIREYLAQPEQEPFGYICNDFNGGATTLYEVKQESVFGKVYKNTPLYLHPKEDE